MEKIETVQQLAAGFCGAESEAELEQLTGFCEAELASWERRLRENLTPDDCWEVFSCAVALCGAADYLTAQNSAAPAVSFSAGSVSVQGRSAADAQQSVQALRQLAERLMRPFAVSQKFSFRSVRG